MTDDALIAAARDAAKHSYSPYSNFAVGAALRFADGSVVTGTNIENASYGLALCAETIAVSKAMADGVRGGLEAVEKILLGEQHAQIRCKLRHFGSPTRPFLGLRPPT